MPRRRPSAPALQPVSEVVGSLLERRGLAEKVEAATALEQWPERVGPRIAAVTRPLRVSGSTLFVAVSSSAWLMELDLLKPRLLRHVNADRKRGRIEQLVLVMGS